MAITAQVAKVRDTYFRQATLAYMSGDGTRANELSKLGRQFHEKAKGVQFKLKEEILEHSAKNEENDDLAFNR